MGVKTTSSTKAHTAPPRKPDQDNHGMLIVVGPMDRGRMSIKLARGPRKIYSICPHTRIIWTKSDKIHSFGIELRDTLTPA